MRLTRNPAAAILAALVLLPVAPAEARLGDLRPVSVIPGGSAFADADSSTLTFGQHTGRPSADGRFVPFTSQATNLVPGQTGPLSTDGAFLRDVDTGQTVLASHKAGDPKEKRLAFDPSVSADGRYVVFSSPAADLVSGFAGSSSGNVYLFDRTDGSIVLVSHAFGSPTTGALGTASAPVISADGRYVAFQSTGSNLVAGQSDSGADDDVFEYEVATGVNRLVSHTSTFINTAASPTSHNPRISDDGGRVAFSSSATNLTSGTPSPGGDSVYVWNRNGSNVVRVNRDAGSPGDGANASAGLWAFSGDGKWVMFNSGASNLVSGFNDNDAGEGEVWVAAVDSNTTFLASHAPGGAASTGDHGATAADLSADGRVAVFESLGSYVPAQVDGGNDSDVYAFDRSTGTVTLVSALPSAPRNAANGDSDVARVSGDGRTIAFESKATDLVLGQDDVAGTFDVFARDLDNGVTRLLSAVAGTTNRAANGKSDAVKVSADGGTVVFRSAASNLVASPLDGNGSTDVFAARNRAPTASAAVTPDSGQVPLTVGLDGSASSDADGQIGSFSWDHGDGTSSAGATSSHTYAAPGTYTVTLTVTDDEGATATAARTVTVGAPAVGPGPPGADTLAPTVASFAASPRSFAPLASGDAIATRAKRGTTVRYQLSEPATVTFTAERRTTGRRVGRRCVKRTKRNAKRKKCTLFVKVRGSFTHTGAAGANSFKFSGRLRRRALARASYRLVATATDAAGNKSTAKRAPFRIVKP